MAWSLTIEDVKTGRHKWVTLWKYNWNIKNKNKKVIAYLVLTFIMAQYDR